MKAGNYQTQSPSVNDLLFGTQNSTGNTVNFRLQDVVNITQAPSIVPTNTLTAYTISNINTYFTGTAGIQFVVTLPTASSNIDGLKYVIMSTANRAATTWITPGATTIVGAPTSLFGGTPVCFQYNNSDTTWYISM